MDRADLSFGQLLFLLTNEVLQNKIRRIEKINKHIINIKNGIHFNEIRIQESLQPNFTNIYIYIQVWDGIYTVYARLNSCITSL